MVLAFVSCAEGRRGGESYFDHVGEDVAQVVVVGRGVVAPVGAFVEELDELVERGGGGCQVENGFPF